MNYLKEILTFYDRMEESQLSASAVSLWHGMMYINNKARWTDRFTASSASLTLWSRLPLSTFKRARKELVEKGYIHYQSRGTGQAPVYQMVPLSEIDNAMVDIPEIEDEVASAVNVEAEGSTDNATEHSAVESMDEVDPDEPMDQGMDQGVAQGTDQSVSQGMALSVDQDVGPLYKHKQNETKPKQNNNILLMDIRTFYNQNFIGKLSGEVRASMEKQVCELGEPLVMEAMKRAVEQNKRSWGYANGICNGWKKKGISTLEQAHADKEAFRKYHSYQGASLGRKEIVPDWFKDRHKDYQPKKQEEEDEVSSEEIARMLAAISSKKNVDRSGGELMPS